MNWLNLNVDHLDSERFVGAEPVDRATWICLLRYCIGQKNSGRIDGCKLWADRKWQQLVRITKEEAERNCLLWQWNGAGIVVWGYPMEHQKNHERLSGISKAAAAKRWENKLISLEKPAKKNGKGNPYVRENPKDDLIPPKSQRLDPNRCAKPI